jgi:hypothetical protein
MPTAPRGPLTRWPKKVAQLKRRLQAILGPAQEMPTAIPLDATCLESLSPFYLLLDSHGVTLSSGSSLRQLHTTALKGQRLEEIFHTMDGGDGKPLESDDLNALLGRLLRLEAKAKPGLEFAGQLIPTWGQQPRQPSDTRPKHQWILDVRPILETMDDLELSGLSLQDLSLLDPMRVSMVTMLMNDSLRQELMDELRSMQP